MKILADIGGTYARFATGDEQAIEAHQKYEAGAFESLEAVLDAYRSDVACEKAPLMIATAAYPDEAGLWRFVNQNEWVIDLQVLGAAGWPVELILNDFEAAVWGLLDLQKGDQTVLKPGEKRNDLSQCLIGPGTGLGLGYLNQGRVHKTHGGHMLATATTEEQREVIQAVGEMKGVDRPIIFENLVSGSGLYAIYLSLCKINGREGQVHHVEGLFENLDQNDVQNALRLFHEFFGLFAHTVVVSGHAYGGLYLTGGVLDRLVEADLFDFECFQRFFELDGVASVKGDLDQTPVIYIKNKHLAMQGLLAANREDGHG